MARPIALKNAPRNAMQTISNMTPNQQALLRKVAARMPETFLITQSGAVVWLDTGKRVMAKELLHVAAEFEKGFVNPGQKWTYINHLSKIVMVAAGTWDAEDGVLDQFDLLTATPEQRFTARLKMWGEM